MAEFSAGLACDAAGCRSAGDKRALMETASHNARESLARHRLRRGADHNSRARALNELAEHLDLPTPPLRIECYDMSHLQGTNYVGSMVVLEDGLPRRSEVPALPGAQR